VIAHVDPDGIGQRVVEVPVPEARYEAIFALRNKLLLLSRPVEGALGHDWGAATPPSNAALECYDLVTDRRETFATEVSEVVVSGDGRRWPTPRLARGGATSAVTSSTAKPDEEHDKEPSGRKQ